MKIWYPISAFCKWRLLEDCLKHAFSKPFPASTYPIIIDNHYPIDKENNRAQIKRLAEEYGCLYIDSGKDRGQNGAMNLAIETVKPGRTDIWAGQDPDDRPFPGFLDAVKFVMTMDPQIAICSLNFWVIKERFAQGKLKEKMVGPHTIWEHPSVEMFLTSAFKMSFIQDIGGFKADYAYYGGIESSLFHEYSKRGLKLVYMRDIEAESAPVNRDDAELFDPEYRQWKTDHIGGFTRSFEEWLIEKGFGSKI